MPDGEGLGRGVPAPTVTPPPVDVVGACVVFGGTTGATFGGAACGVGFGGAVKRATDFSFGLAFVLGLGVSFGLGLGVGVEVAIDVGVVTTAGAGNGVWTGVGEGVAVTTVATAAGSALAVLRWPLKPGHVNANAVNATTTTAKAISASVDRRGHLSPNSLNTGTG